MNMENMNLKNDLSDKQLILLKDEMEKKQTNTVIAWLLWFFLGNLGIHAYYLGKNSRGTIFLVLYLIGIFTSWLVVGIPFLIAWFVLWVVDAVNMSKNIQTRNEEIELAIIKNLLYNSRDREPLRKQANVTPTQAPTPVEPVVTQEPIAKKEAESLESLLDDLQSPETKPTKDSNVDLNKE